ncbi:unnamed protein product [Spirodela intermedia]|uniref:Uncharacterized protein n=1 Tax=Spirodela intermedia TaxID=51605 RepID=A0A7I8L820_SPIIN|nr:unnamed protein product [Spirodela intermedia]
MKWVFESSPTVVTWQSRKIRSWMEVGRMLGSFILRSTQQEEALHHIWYALRRLRKEIWRLPTLSLSKESLRGRRHCTTILPNA